MTRPVHIVRRAPDSLTIRLLGDVDPCTIQALHDELIERGDAKRAAVIDLRQLTGFTLPARSAFVPVHQHLVRVTDRRAFIASTARFRGFALWILHVSPDPAGKVVVGPEAAESWLASTDTRLGAAEKLMHRYTKGAS